ncbi:hypothetical protein [Fibrella arboris]|uniref:hypothetical protein n=1 Tax=Fibrella arboris TaxID=3242486 RepID=UPI0035215576
MRFILLAIRDFVIVNFRQRGYSEDQVYSNAKQGLVAWFSGWYMSLVVGVAVMSHKLGFKPVFDHSFLAVLLGGLLLLTPYVLFMWPLADKIMQFPELVNETISRKQSVWISWVVFLVGILMIGIVPTVLEALVPAMSPR